MTWWSEFADIVNENAPLGRLTWFRVGGAARYLCRPRDAEELCAVLRRTREEGLEFRVLGAGANVLVSDRGFDGVVIRLDAPAFGQVDLSSERLRVGGGVDLMRLAWRCCDEGLTGLEGLAGIPATVGGAIRMNAGGRFGEIGEVIREIEVVRPDGTPAILPRERAGFAYRSSTLRGAVVVGAVLAVGRDDPRRVRARFEECYNFKKQTQPLNQQSAGCVFKNPPGESAGRLIDRAGLKGERCGSACVSEQHANFIVAEAGATASDVLRLIERVRRRVRAVFSTDLELEVEVWGGAGRRAA